MDGAQPDVKSPGVCLQSAPALVLLDKMTAVNISCVSKRY